jgi:Ca2+-binding RTX toxin-like protein
MAKSLETATVPAPMLEELEADEFEGLDDGSSQPEAPPPPPAPVGNFHINLIFNPSVANAPQGFREAMQNGAAQIEALFSDNITINVTVGWGEISGQPITRSGIALGGPFGHFYSYSQTVAALSNDRTTPDDFTAVGAMPASLNPNGNGSIFVSQAEEKALGLMPGTNSSVDGRIGFATDFPSSFWVGAAIHEITHAMGRMSGYASYGILDLMRYSGGQHVFAGGTPAYFSIDNGVTRLANFDTTSDFGDFVRDSFTPNDPNNAYISGNSITPLDAQIMDVIGFNRVLTQAGSVSISDVTVSEGNSNSTATFTVTRTSGSAAFSVNYATAAGTATAGVDYGSVSGTLSFAAGVNSLTISVPVFGDTAVESNETFFVNLSGASNGATISRSQAVGTIVNDDSPTSSISIADLSIFEGDSGTRTATFTVTRTGGSGAFTVNYATANGTASAGADYVAASGVLTFDSSVNTQTILVTINGDTTSENDETFFVNLSGATNGTTIARAQATGTILNDDPGDDFRDDASTTGAVAVGGSATGNLEVAGDHDWFRVQLTAGQTYSIRLEGVGHNGGTLSDPYLELYNASSAFITSNDDGGGGLDSLIVFTAPTTGAFFIDAGAFTDFYSGRYTVSVLTGTPSDDFAANTGTTGSVSVGASATGNLDFPGDHDWFRVQLVAGVQYTIDLTGSSAGGGSLWDPYERLYNSSGTLLREDDDSAGSLNSRIDFTPTTSGTYFVDAGSFDDDSSGTYTVRVNGPSGPGPGNDTLVGGPGNDVLDGDGGIDTVDYSTTTQGIVVDLSAASNQATGPEIGVDQLVNIEYVIGGRGNDRITGNALSNRLDGGPGNDTLTGGAGPDAMVGGPGDDVYFIDQAGDVVVENPGEGNDTVNTAVSYVLPGTVENLVLEEGAGAVNGIGNDASNRITGNSGHNHLVGGAGADALDGGGGDDDLDGGAGGDALFGGSGFDYARYDGAPIGVYANLLTPSVNNGDAAGDSYSSIEGLVGSARGDILAGDGSANVLFGMAGNDVLVGNGGPDTMAGGLGDDTYSVDNGGDVVVENPGEGNDTVNAAVGYGIPDTVENLVLVEGSGAVAGIGSNASNRITGNSGHNHLVGGAGADALDGGGSDDDLDGGAGGDALFGGAGFDYARYDSAPVGVYANLLNPSVNNGDAAGDSYSSIEGLIGSAQADILAGDHGANALYGMAGDDFLVGNGGPDTLVGGDGFDYAHYFGASVGVYANLLDPSVNNGDAAGDNYSSIEGLVGTAHGDILAGDNAGNALLGFSGNDVLVGNGGPDTMTGGLGDDAYSVDQAGDVVVENPGEGNDTVNAAIAYALGANVENLVLVEGSGAVAGIGNDASNRIAGNSGHNHLIGGAGADALDGGGGDDDLDGGAGGDALFGGSGFDYARYDSAPVGVYANLLNPSVNNGDAAGDSYSSIEGLVGSAQADVLAGDHGANALYGMAGDDALVGNGGNDTLAGGAGDDVLEGGAGDDALDGEAGNDVFAFYAGFGHDTVAGFAAGAGPGDVIEFHDGLFAGFADVLAHAAQTGSSVTITHDPANAIVLANTALASLSADDFRFA